MPPAGYIEDRLYRGAALARFCDLEHGWAAEVDFRLKRAEDAEKPRRSFDYPALGRIETWNDVDRDTGIGRYQTFYCIAATGEVLSADSRIRFTQQDNLANLIAGAGLAVEQWFGDWQGGPYRET